MLLAYLGLICFWQFLVYPHPETWFPLAAWLWRATDGLINYNLTSNLADQFILIGVLLMGLGRFRPSELGLDRTKLPAAVGRTAIIWAASQIVLVLVLALINQPIVLNPEWTATGWTRAAGQWLGQLFGNTPMEEVVFRGFLLPQCLLLMLSWMPKARLGMQIAFALVLSQLLFALPHVFLNSHLPQGQWLLLGAQLTVSGVSRADKVSEH
jgi:membrane protease YdiL (CAAX protease family)